jgi:tetratricopeptide repeat protein
MSGSLCVNNSFAGAQGRQGWAETFIQTIMKPFLVFLFVCSVCLFSRPPAICAQDEPRAAWLVSNFDVTVRDPGAERALNARAIVSLRNVGRGAGSTLSLRINSKAEIKSVSIGSASAAYRLTPEPRGGAQRVTITLPAAIAPNEIVSATVDYSLPVSENSGLTAISPLGSQFLPLSLWYPSANTPFAVRGADYAPFRLTVTGATAISSGNEKSASGNSVFEQALNAQPFFVTGNWDRIEGGTNAKGISAFLLKGAGADERKQAEALIALTSDARNYFAGLFGSTPDTPLRLVAVTRGGGFDDAGTMLLGEGTFRRRKIDTTTALGISEAVARVWVGAEAPVRGEGHGVLREGLVRFLATLFIEKQFGVEAAEAERVRQRLAYAAIAKRDGPLSRTTPLDATYFNSVANKGAMVWRLVDHIVGRDAFVATVRGLLANAKTDVEGFSLARSRAMFAERGASTFKALLDQAFDQPTDMDLMAGLPRLEGGQWVAALRNLGSTEATVNVSGTTDTGQRVNAQAIIPAHDFGQAVFKNASRIVAVEVDPEKFYPQIDYANDAAPHSVEVNTAQAEANRLFGAQEYAKAEALARQLLASSPGSQEGRVVLARALLAQNKIDDAEREFRKLAEERAPMPATLAWSSIGLGEIALKRGQATEAARNFSEGVRADAEYASTLAGRAARIRAEGAPAIDESAKSFVGQLDAAIRSGRQADIAPLVVTGELVGFVRGVVGTQPEAWQTRILRSEPLDANRMALDVAINSKQLGVEHSGTAVFILARVGGTWRLNAIEFFEVR